MLEQNVSGPAMSRAMRQTLDSRMVCCTLSDTELGMLSAEYLNDIIENGWWSEIGRRHMQRLLETAGRKSCRIMAIAAPGTGA